MSRPNKVAVVDPNGPKPSAFASNLIISGNTVYLAGQVGVNAEGKFIDGTIKDRTRQALENARDRLAYIGLDLSDVVSVQIFLSKYNDDFADMNEAYVVAFPKDGPSPSEDMRWGSGAASRDRY